MPASHNLLLITLRLFSAHSRYKVDFLSYGLSPRTRQSKPARRLLVLGEANPDKLLEDFLLRRVGCHQYQVI